MKRNKKKSIQLKDLISIGVFTAMYFITVTISNLLVVFLIPGFSYAFIPVMSALLSGTIYMLMIARVAKFGAITIMGSIVGLFQFINGHFPGSLLIAVGFALIADMIAYGSKYKRKNGILGSYVVFSFSTIGPAVPLFLFPDMYVSQLIEQGRDAVYIENVFASISQNTFLILIVSMILAAVIGGIFGQHMMKKHFVKAGII